MSDLTVLPDEGPVQDVYIGIEISEGLDREFDFSLAYYLAGPMSGYPEYNFPSFDLASAILRSVGVNVMSPHEIDHGETPDKRGSLPYQVYIDAGIALLEKCQGIILLPGWPQSSGSCAELSRAIDFGMQVYYFKGPDENGIGTQLINMSRRPPA